MKTRISLLIPVILIISTFISTLIIYINSTYTAEKYIRKQAIKHISLDISRLQNILYNYLTENTVTHDDARLNLSVAAMDTNIKHLLIVDELDNILISNRYTEENSPASTHSKYNKLIASETRNNNTANIFFNSLNTNLLNGYFPIVLELESSQDIPIKRMGIVYVDYSISSPLKIAKQEAIYQAMTFGALMSIISILVAILLHFIVSIRLTKLTNAANQLATGNLNSRANIHGNDEISELGLAFDEMAITIKNELARQKESEKNLLLLNNTLEDKINERTSNLQEAQRIGKIGHWSYDLTSNKLEWSDEIYRIYGLDKKTYTPNYNDFLNNINKHDTQLPSEVDTSTNNASHNIDYRINTTDNTERWVHKEAITKFNENNDPVCISGIIQDITERKLFEHDLLLLKEEAEASNNAKSDFLSRMSHELRTPLNAILGFSQLLEMSKLDKLQKSQLNEITDAGDHLLNLINELLDLSCIESGNLKISLEETDINKIIKQVINLNSNLINENLLTINNQQNSKYFVNADPFHLKQVLVNLISNAAKYNRKNGEITINYIHKDINTLLIEITDTGYGIKNEEIDKVFTPFEILNAKHTKTEGKGIGLALSKKLIELMNGKIGIESTPGTGTTFWIEIPLLKVVALTSHSENQENTKTAKENQRKVLYIEDNAANLKVVTSFIKYHQKFVLLTATTGNQGYDVSCRQLPDVILLDINLPDMQGYQVLSALRKNPLTTNIPVIALSADAMPFDVEKGLTAGFNKYLTKPVNLKELLDVLNEYTQLPLS